MNETASLRRQKALGVLLLVISAVLLYLAYGGTTPADRDCTVVLLIVPLGFYLVLTKACVIVDRRSTNV